MNKGGEARFPPNPPMLFKRINGGGVALLDAKDLQENKWGGEHTST
jgi:hypothetical protein